MLPLTADYAGPTTIVRLTQTCHVDYRVTALTLSEVLTLDEGRLIALQLCTALRALVIILPV